MNSQFVENLKTLKKKQNFTLQHIAPMLEIKSAQLYKIDKRLKQLKREQIPIIAKILKAIIDALMRLRLVDQIYTVVKDEKFVNKAMQVTEKKINLKKKIK
jgi:hypothetical protein